MKGVLIMDVAATYFNEVGLLPIILVVIGLGLLIVEIVVPGFGIPGLLGILSSIAGIILWSRNLSEAVILFTILIMILVIVFFVVARSAQRGRISKSRVILKESVDTEAGYSSSLGQSELVGKEGIAVSEMRPAGIGVFDEKRIDVVSDGEFIPKGSNIIINRVEGRRIVVSKTND